MSVWEMRDMTENEAEFIGNHSWTNYSKVDEVEVVQHRNIPGPDSAAEEVGTEGQELLTNSHNDIITLINILFVSLYIYLFSAS